jgi:hypothetical protein
MNRKQKPLNLKQLNKKQNFGKTKQTRSQLAEVITF